MPLMKSVAKISAFDNLPADILNYMYISFVCSKGVKHAALWLRSLSCLNHYLQHWAQEKINESSDIGFSSTWHSIPEISLRAGKSKKTASLLVADLMERNAFVHANFRESKDIHHAGTIVKSLLQGPASTELQLDMSRRFQASIVDNFIDAKSADKSRSKALKKGLRDLFKLQDEMKVKLSLSLAGRNICDPKFFLEIAGKNFSSMLDMDFSRIDMKNLRGFTENYQRPIHMGVSALKNADKNFSCLFNLAKKSLDAGSLRRLNFSQTDMAGNHLEHLVSDFLLGSRHALDTLDLRANFIGTNRPKFIKENSGPYQPVIKYGINNGVGAIVKLLTSKNCPQTINLRNCYLTDADANELLAALKENSASGHGLSAVKNLYLGGNLIADHHPIWMVQGVNK